MRFRAIIVKDLRLFLRDRGGLFWAFVMPLIFITVFGLAFSGEKSEIHVLVVQQDNDPAAYVYVSMLDNILDIEKMDNIAAAEASVREGRAVATIVVPEGFGENKARVRLIYDELQQTRASEVISIVEAVTLRFLGQESLVVTQSVRGERLDPFQQTVPGMGIMFILFMGGIGGILRILDERKSGTLRRNLLAPVGRAGFLGGQVLIGLLIGCMQLAVFFGVGIVGFGMPVKGSILLVALIGILVVLFSVGMGLVLSSFVRSSAAAPGAVMALVLPMCALGGLWFPLGIMPQYMQSIAQALPTTHAMTAFQDVIVRGKDLLAIAPSLLVLAGFAIFFLAAGLILFKWKE